MQSRFEMWIDQHLGVIPDFSNASRAPTSQVLLNGGAKVGNAAAHEVVDQTWLGIACIDQIHVPVEMASDNSR